MDKMDMKFLQALVENTLKECLVGFNECKDPARSPYMSDRGAKMMADRLLLNLERANMYQEQLEIRKQMIKKEEESNG
jgi:hypothetical protein